MRKFLYYILFVIVALSISSCGKNDDIEKLSDNEIYFFYQETCPHCHDAAKYIKAKYPKLKLIARNIKLPGNWKLFQSAVKRYNIKTAAGTPLICFGEKYIMGWGEQDKQIFDIYVQPYLPNE